jgi:hypothetical protein
VNKVPGPSYLRNEPNKLVLHYTWLERLPGDKHASLLASFVSYKENYVLRIWPLRRYSQHFVFFVTFEWTQEARVFVNGKPFQPDVM